MNSLPILRRRGVYLSHQPGPGGERVFVAVDSRGNRPFQAFVYPGEDSSTAELALWDLLDRFDPPRPHLFLIR